MTLKTTVALEDGLSRIFSQRDYLARKVKQQLCTKSHIHSPFQHLGQIRNGIEYVSVEDVAFEWCAGQRERFPQSPWVVVSHGGKEG